MHTSFIAESFAGRLVRLARRTGFSSAHFYAQPAFTEAQNKSVFGLCHSEHGHGHDYVLEAFYLGRIQPSSGLVVNLVDVDRLLRQCAEPFEHRHLNRDVPHFQTQVPTTENIARYAYEWLAARPFPEMRLERVRLYENADIWADWGDAETAESVEAWTVEATINAQHSLSDARLSPSENEALYGACYRLHGHDYRVQATFAGSYDRATGLFVDRELATCALERAVLRPFHGRHLNRLLANTSCEALACHWFDLAQAELPDGALLGLAIQETRKNWFERTRAMAATERKP